MSSKVKRLKHDIFVRQGESFHAQRFKLLITQTQVDRRTQTQSHKTMETHESTLVWDRFVSRKNEAYKNVVYHRISKISL